jgi:chemotaxis protein MotB
MLRHFLSVFSIALLLTGCVAQDKYGALKLERDQMAEQLNQAQTSEAAARAAANAWKQQHGELIAKAGDQSDALSKSKEQIAQLDAENQLLQQRIKDAMNNAGNQTIYINNAIPQELSNALTAFAAENPTLVEYDSAAGRLRFKSDVTFAPGSAQLTAGAQNAVTRLAGILNSPAAKPFDIFVEGHTDSTPVTSSATKAQGHKDNWYLSSHRAISVKDQLVTGNVAPSRIGVVGYGDQRPVASNATTDGKAKNRRVEIALLPAGVKAAQIAPGGEFIPNKSPVKATPELNKDSVVPPAAPARDRAITTTDRAILNK